MTTYNPFRSTVTDETLVKFLQEDMKYDLESVPGIGPAAKKILQEILIMNSFQLFAKFLQFKVSEGDGCVQHCNRFYGFLTEIGITSNRHSITKSIAEKAGIFLPNLYQEYQFSHLEKMDTEC